MKNTDMASSQLTVIRSHLHSAQTTALKQCLTQDLKNLYTSLAAHISEDRYHCVWDKDMDLRFFVDYCQPSYQHKSTIEEKEHIFFVLQSPEFRKKPNILNLLLKITVVEAMINEAFLPLIEEEKNTYKQVQKILFFALFLQNIFLDMANILKKYDAQLQEPRFKAGISYLEKLGEKMHTVFPEPEKFYPFFTIPNSITQNNHNLFEKARENRVYAFYDTKIKPTVFPEKWKIETFMLLNDFLWNFIYDEKTQDIKDKLDDYKFIPYLNELMQKIQINLAYTLFESLRNDFEENRWKIIKITHNMLKSLKNDPEISYRATITTLCTLLFSFYKLDDAVKKSLGDTAVEAWSLKNYCEENKHSTVDQEDMFFSPGSSPPEEPFIYYQTPK